MCVCSSWQLSVAKVAHCSDAEQTNEADIGGKEEKRAATKGDALIAL